MAHEYGKHGKHPGAESEKGVKEEYKPGKMASPAEEEAGMRESEKETENKRR